MLFLRILRCLAWLSLAVAVIWWAWARPLVRGMGAEFSSQFTEAGKWEAQEKALKAGYWTHDDGWRVGYYGGKDWMAQLMREVAEGGEVSGCFNFHKEVALAYMTNQSEPESGTSAEQWWQDWWRDHAGLSQEEWIQEGFAQAGFSVALPASRDDWLKLLKILGANIGPTPRGEHAHLYSENLRYNAFRWLRDSEFDPVTFALEAPSVIDDGEVRGGLRQYQKFLVPTIPHKPPGYLDLVKGNDKYDLSWAWFRQPVLVRPEIQQRLEVGMLLVLAGSLLVLLLTPRVAFWFGTAPEPSSSD